MIIKDQAENLRRIMAEENRKRLANAVRVLNHRYKIQGLPYRNYETIPVGKKREKYEKA